MTIQTEMQHLALRQWEHRRANPPERADNAALPAGSDMLYYCVSCGFLSDVKPEDYFLAPPRKL